MLPDYKNLFLIFPFGCGGNHLANMLSMTPFFTKRFRYRIKSNHGKSQTSRSLVSMKSAMRIHKLDVTTLLVGAAPTPTAPPSVR